MNPQLSSCRPVEPAVYKWAVVSFGLTLVAITNTAFGQKGLQPDVAHPAVIATTEGTLEVFVRGMNSHLVQRSWNGSNWSGWKNLGGDLTAAPTVTSSEPGRLDVFVRGMSGHLVHRIFEHGGWSGWYNLGGDLTSAPAAVSPAPGRIDVFVRGLNGKLVQRTYNNGGWGGWINLGGDLTSAPAAVVTARNRIEVFVRGMNFHLVQRSFNGSTWSGWKNLGGDLTAAPAVAAYSPNDIHVFVRGMNGHLVQRIWNGSRWGGWNNLGGDLTAAPAAAATGNANLEVLVRGATDDLVQRSWTGGSWSGWKNLGGNLRGTLRARLRVLSHNVYGLKYPTGWALPPDKSVCELRTKEFGRRVANAQLPYDIVAVQEYYSADDAGYATCHHKHLTNAIRSTGRYRNSNNSYRFLPDISRHANGGIGVFSLHPIVQCDDWRWDNDASPLYKAAEGFIFARISVPTTGISVDTYIVHLNHGSDEQERRKGQLRQLARKIQSLSRDSGNPVIVMGDFNIGGPPSGLGNQGYGDIMSILKHPQDLWMAANPENNGLTFDCTTNNVGALRGCSGRGRIDYIFAVTDPAFTNSPYVVKLLKKDDIKTVHWRVDYDYDPYVSDHYGIEALIEIREK